MVSAAIFATIAMITAIVGLVIAMKNKKSKENKDKKNSTITSSGIESSQAAVAPSIDKKLSVDNQPKKTVASESNAEWANEPLHCPKCRTKLHDKTPRFGMIRNCSNCGASFEISNYKVK